MRGIAKFIGLLTLALTVGIAGCDTITEPSASLEGPGARSDVLITLVQKDGYTIVKETDVDVGAVTGTIDQNGGRISLGQHTLEVPAGSVSAPTTFTITKLDGDELMVRLTATRLLLNDVGSAGFPVPVRLTLSYKNAAELPKSEGDLKILWVRPDGQREAQVSHVDITGKRVTGSLNHFSDFALGFPK